MKFKFYLLILLIITACTPSENPSPTLVVTITKPITNTVTPTFTLTENPTQTETATITPTMTFTPSTTPTPTATITMTPIPTYVVLRGEVNAAHVNCYYGPGRAYLYKYGLVGGSNLEIIGRNPDTNYLQVQAIGGDNPCWMNSEWMNIKGDPVLIQPIPAENVVLPLSPYYGPPTGQNASRNGDQVTISWNWFGLRAGDDSLQYPYLVEAWVCQDGKITFIPIGSWENIITVTDQAGCETESHARLYTVEKHGYTPWVQIPWPSHPENP